MMQQFRELVTLTVLRPAEAMAQIKAMQLPIRIAWVVLVIGVMLSTVAIFARVLVFPVEIFPGVLFLDVVTPFGLFVTMTIVAGASAVLLTYAGRQLGGSASFTTVLTYVAWLQVMRAVVEGAGLIVSFASFQLAVLAINLAGLYGIWIILQFQKVSHGFDSVGRALGSLVLTFVGLVLVISLLVAPFISV
jgi:hypothetical protein